MRLPYQSPQSKFLTHSLWAENSLCNWLVFSTANVQWWHLITYSQVSLKIKRVIMVFHKFMTCNSEISQKRSWAVGEPEQLGPHNSVSVKDHGPFLFVFFEAINLAISVFVIHIINSALIRWLSFLQNSVKNLR